MLNIKKMHEDDKGRYCAACHYAECRCGLELRWPIQVDAESLERIVAFLEREDLQDTIDDDESLREAVDRIGTCLNEYAEQHPAFDDR